MEDLSKLINFLKDIGPIIVFVIPAIKFIYEKLNYIENQSTFNFKSDLLAICFSHYIINSIVYLLTCVLLIKFFSISAKGITFCIITFVISVFIFYMRIIYRYNKTFNICSTIKDVNIKYILNVKTKSKYMFFNIKKYIALCIYSNLYGVFYILIMRYPNIKLLASLFKCYYLLYVIIFFVLTMCCIRSTGNYYIISYLIVRLDMTKTCGCKINLKLKYNVIVDLQGNMINICYKKKNNIVYGTCSDYIIDIQNKYELRKKKKDKNDKFEN